MCCILINVVLLAVCIGRTLAFWTLDGSKPREGYRLAPLRQVDPIGGYPNRIGVYLDRGLSKIDRGLYSPLSENDRGLV